MRASVPSDHRPAIRAATSPVLPAPATADDPTVRVADGLPPLVPVIRDAQLQIAEFFASDGRRVVRPGLPFWQVPITDSLPEDLGYIP